MQMTAAGLLSLSGGGRTVGGGGGTRRGLQSEFVYANIYIYTPSMRGGTESKQGEGAAEVRDGSGGRRRNS